jgi:hypothetical protein
MLRNNKYTQGVMQGIGLPEEVAGYCSVQAYEYFTHRQHYLRLFGSTNRMDIYIMLENPSVDRLGIIGILLCVSSGTSF